MKGRFESLVLRIGCFPSRHQCAPRSPQAPLTRARQGDPPPPTAPPYDCAPALTGKHGTLLAVVWDRKAISRRGSFVFLRECNSNSQTRLFQKKKSNFSKRRTKHFVTKGDFPLNSALVRFELILLEKTSLSSAFPDSPARSPRVISPVRGRPFVRSAVTRGTSARPVSLWMRCKALDAPLSPLFLRAHSGKLRGYAAVTFHAWHAARNVVPRNVQPDV